MTRPEVQIALNHVPSAKRLALAALFALDAALGQVVQTTTQPLVGQMRLTWWHERLAALDDGGNAAAEPVLRSLAADVVPRGIAGEELAAMVEGWEPLLDAPPLTDAMLAAHGEERGARLFRLAALMLGGREDVAAAGAGWALVDLAAHWSDEAEAACAQSAARAAFARHAGRLPRPLKILARLARARAEGPAADLRAPPSRRALLRALLP